MEWDEAKKFSDYVRLNGVEQFINSYERLKDRDLDELKWGDEVTRAYIKQCSNFHLRLSIWLSNLITRSIHAN